MQVRQSSESRDFATACQRHRSGAILSRTQGLKQKIREYMDIEANEAAAPASLTRADVDKALQEKRNHGERRACYPCSTRKVKCDRTVPCQTCFQRGHPDLCIPSGRSREKVASRRRPGARRAPSARPTTPSCTSPPPQRAPQHVLENVPHLGAINEMTAPPQDMPRVTFVGQDSLPSLVNTTPHTDGTPSDDMRHTLGLQNTWDIYPYMKRSSTQDLANEVSALVPAHQDVLR